MIWIFDFDIEQEVKRMPGTVLALAKDLKAAKARAVKAKTFVGKNAGGKQCRR